MSVKYAGRDQLFVTTNPEGDSYLSRYQEHAQGFTSAEAGPEDLTIEGMAEFLDQQAENDNRHELVGEYSYLAHLIRTCWDNESAGVVVHRVLHKLIQRGGLGTQ